MLDVTASYDFITFFGYFHTFLITNCVSNQYLYVKMLDVQVMECPLILFRFFVNFAQN